MKNINQSNSNEFECIQKKPDQPLEISLLENDQIHTQLPSFTEVVGKMIKLERDLEEKSLLIEELKVKQLTGSKQIEELQGKPNNVTNNVLQLVCVSDKDNYLDMLTDRLGNFDKALEYIKDCALSSLVGDCKLAEKIYFLSEKNDIRFTDKSKTKIEYFNEKKEKVVDKKELFARKLANNLQNSYLKGVNHLLNNNLNNRLCPNKFLEEYDIQTWNQHIYELSDCQYQKKIINQLDIP